MSNFKILDLCPPLPPPLLRRAIKGVVDVASSVSYLGVAGRFIDTQHGSQTDHIHLPKTVQHDLCHHSHLIDKAYWTWDDATNQGCCVRCQVTCFMAIAAWFTFYPLFVSYCSFQFSSIL